MRIIKEDQNIMILKDRHLVVFVVGTAFALVGFAVIFKLDFITNQPPAWSGFIGVLLGAFVILAGKITTISLDKRSNKLIHLRRGLTGKIIKEYNLDQIKEVELSVAYSSSTKGSGNSYHLAFVFTSGEIIPLDPGSSSVTRIMGRQIIAEKGLGTRIADFLNVPFRERQPPTLSETLSTVSSAIQSAAEKEIEKQKQSNSHGVLPHRFLTRLPALPKCA